MDVPHLRRLRQEAVLSQQQLAQTSGVARDTVSKLETAQRQAYPKTIQSLAASLGVEPRELVGIQEPAQPADVENPVQPEEREVDGSSEDTPKRRAGF